MGLWSLKFTNSPNGSIVKLIPSNTTNDSNYSSSLGISFYKVKFRRTYGNPAVYYEKGAYKLMFGEAANNS